MKSALVFSAALIVWACTLSGEPVSLRGMDGPSLGCPAPQTGGKGRYHTLLKTLEVPGDGATYGDFCDYGYWSGTAYAGHSDLPAGYWVYLYPNWYIFKDAQAQGKRSWGPQQATGQPDTPGAGDLATAWASKTADGQPEWLDLTYETPVQPLAVLVYETYNPGALCRICTFDAKGNEVQIWKGIDPTSSERSRGVSIVPIETEYKINRIRIHMDSQRVAGWNEIDAVGLLDTEGKTHWACSATASSTWAQ